MKQFSYFLVALLLLSTAGCDLFEKEEEEKELDEEDLKAVITFNEWLYRAGNPPRLKYYIEKETSGNVRMETVMTMYSDGELVGLNTFTVTLTAPINIDYFVIEPDKNLPVDEIELKDIYLDGVKYSLSKTFRVGPEKERVPAEAESEN